MSGQSCGEMVSQISGAARQEVHESSPFWLRLAEDPVAATFEKCSSISRNSQTFSRPAAPSTGAGSPASRLR